MTLRTIWRVIARWRWIVIPGLVVALAAGTALFLRTPKTYTVEASYLFLSPVTDTKGVASNPFLQLGNGVAQAVDVLAVSLTDGQTVRGFTRHAPKLEYTAARDVSVGAPLMVISVQDVDRKAAAATLASLGTILTERLNTMQAKAGAPQTQWITMTKLTDDPKPTIGYSDGIRNGVLGFAAVLLAMFVVVAVAERARVRREARRERLRAEGRPVKREKRSKKSGMPVVEGEEALEILAFGEPGETDGPAAPAEPDGPAEPDPLRELLEQSLGRPEETPARAEGRSARAPRRPRSPVPAAVDANTPEDALADDPLSLRG